MIHGLICKRDHDGVPAGELYSIASDIADGSYDTSRFERVVLDAGSSMEPLRNKRWDAGQKQMIDNTPPKTQEEVLADKAVWLPADRDEALRLLLLGGGKGL